ncbi:choice-of-anchor A family protein [Vibrio sp. ECSMB14106]|uniref:choice-of-anchor A family protein n=1 Tax=Vibrio sp. ECSMB14106 TaxID=1638949 RepID=UPI000619F7D0|nr:choice-of-anchor A family protein [Vibrio sp. ECSMB14106]
MRKRNLLLLSLAYVTSYSANAENDDLLWPATNFSGYIFSDFNSGSGNSQRGLAVGGNLDIGGYSIGAGLPPDYSDFGLLVEGDANFSLGRLYQGKIRVEGDASGVSSSVIAGFPDGVSIENIALENSILSSKEYYQEVSRQLAAAEVTGESKYQWGGLYLEGDCASPVQVFNIDGAQFQSAHTFEFSCLPPEATIIINMLGDSTRFNRVQNKSMSSLAVHRERVLFNFPDSSELNLAGIKIEGHVLAPNANINAPHGDLMGTVIANQWIGSMHLGGELFKGDLTTLVSFNEPPVIESTPVTQVTWPDEYQYVVVATDPDQDPITYSLAQSPNGMMINPITGVISWVTTYIPASSFGKFPVEVIATDDKGEFDSQIFAVRLDAPSNYAPEITSTPITESTIDTLYSYMVSAIDLDGDILSFRLDNAPQNMLIDAETGLITWPISYGDTGSHLVKVVVSDGKAEDRQSFNVNVTAPGNNAPVIVSAPISEAVLQELYLYQVVAIDEESHPLTFELLDAPVGMVIDADTGLITWKPESIEPPATVSVQVRDAPGLTDNQQYQLTVVSVANEPPQITSLPVEVVAKERPYHYQVTATDDKDTQLHFSLVHGHKDITIDPITGEVQWQNVLLPPQGFEQTNQQCKIIQGTTTRVSGSADVFVVVDESGSMSGEHNWLKDLVPSLEAGLAGAGVGEDTAKNLYGLIGYERGPRYLVVDGEKMVESASFSRLAAQLRLYGGTEDGYRAMKGTLDTYPLRTDSAKNLILVTDEDRDVTLSWSYQQMLEQLKSTGTLLNAVTNSSFRCDDGSSAMGMTAEGIGFVADGSGSYYTCSGTRAVSGSGASIRDYVNLAIESGGAAWDLNFLRSGGLRAKSFSEAIVDIKIKEIIDQLPPIYQADLQVNRITLSESKNGLVDLAATLNNRGLADTAHPFAVAFYSQGVFIGQVDVQSIAAESSQLLVLKDIPESALGDDIETIVVSGNEECLTDNNETRAAIAKVKVTDSQAAEATQWFAVNVTESNEAPVIEPVPPVVLEVGEKFQLALNVSDPNVGDDFSFALVDAPAGMRVNGTSGVVTWQPTQSDVGQLLAEVAVQDLAGLQSTTLLSFDVLDFLRAPIIISEPLLQAQVGASYYYQVVAESDRNARLVYQLIESPEGMIIDANTGEISWRPDQASGDGGHSVIVEVIDDKNLAAIQSFVISAVTTGDAPEFTSTPTTYLQLGETFTYQVLVSDSLGQPIDVSLQAFPDGMTLDANNLVLWQPSKSGTYSVRIAARSAGGLVTTQSFDVQVVETANQPPLIASQPSWKVQSNGDLHYQVLASDPEGESLSYLLMEAPAGMVIDTDGLVIWPASTQLDGKFSVRIRVADQSGVFAEQSFTFSYYPSNAAPEFTSSPTGIAAIDTPYKYLVSAKDPNGDPVSFSLATAPEGAVLTASNEIEWTPNASQLGTHTFVVVAEDPFGMQSTQSFNVTVREVLNNAYPVITSVPLLEAFVRTSYQDLIIAADPDGDALTYRLIEAPAGMTVSGNGTVIWLPEINQKGSNPVTLRVYDNYGAYAEQMYSIRVNSGNEPVITSTPVLSAYNGMDYAYPMTVVDLDNDPLRYQLDEGPVGMAVSNSGVLTWSVTENDVGDHYVSVSVFDSVGNSDTQKFNLTVKYLGESQPPVLTSLPKLRARTESVYLYQVVASDPDGDALRYRLLSAPEGMGISQSGLVQWLANNKQIGLQDVELEVSDLTGKAVTQRFAIEVTAPGEFNRRICRVPLQ